MNPAENYILNQEEPHRGVLLFLQAFIENTIPELELKYKYKIPFYYLEGRPFCYLNQSKDYVDLGFWMAAHIEKNKPYLTKAGRKLMRSLRYRSLEDINPEILGSVLKEAYELKDQKFYKK